MLQMDLRRLMKKPSGHLLQFKNCRLLRNHQIVREDLWIRNGKIVNPEPIYFDERLIADTVFDCRGLLVAPGYIDLQINGAFGYDFSCNSSAEDALDHVAKGLLGHGVTSFCPTVITSSHDVYHQILPKMCKRAGDQNGATILGIHLEGPFISIDKPGAHPVDLIRRFDGGINDVLKTYGYLDNVRVVTLAPELSNACSVTRELIRKGIMVSLGHSAGSLADGEAAVHAGATFITHLFNAMLPFHHRDPGLVGLLASENIPKDRRIFFGIIADGIHTHPAALRIAHSVHPEGLVLVTDAIALMGLSPGRHHIGKQLLEIKDNKALVVGTDTLCGSIATMTQCVQHLMEATGCSVVEALEAASLHPAQALGIADSKGTLNFDADADFIFLNDNLDVQMTYIGGQRVWQNSNMCDLLTVLKGKPNRQN